MTGCRCWYGGLASVVTLLSLLPWHLALAQPDPPADTKKVEPRVDAHGDPLPALALARLGTIRLRNPEPVVAATLSGDGKLLASTSNRIDIKIHDALAGKLLRSIKVGFISGDVLSFSPDNQTIAAINGNNDLLLLEAETGKVLHQLKPPAQQRFSGLAFSLDGKVLVGSADSSGVAGSVTVYAMPTGNQVAQLDVLQNFRVMAALSADGKLLATYGHYLPRANEKQLPDASQVVQLWDITTGKEVRRIKLPQGNVVAAALSPDGKLLATASGGATLTLWEVETGKEVCRLAGRRGLGAFLRFAPDGKALAAGTYDGVTFLWDTKTWKRLGVCPSPAQRSVGVVFPEQGTALGWGIDGHALRLWEVPGGKLLTPADGHVQRISCVVFNDKGKKLWTGSLDGRLCQWDVATGKLLQQVPNLDKLQGNADGYPASAPGNYWTTLLSPNCRVLATGTAYANWVRLWDPAARQILCELECGRYDLSAIAFSADGGLVAVGDRDHVAKVWNVTSGQELFQLKLPDGEVRKLAFAPDGKTLAIGFTYYDRATNLQMSEVHIVKATTGEKVSGWKRASHFLSALAFAPDGKTLAVTGQPRLIQLLNPAKGEEVGSLDINDGQFFGLAFSPDGRTLAAAGFTYGSPSKIWICELATHSVRMMVQGQQNTVDQLAYSPDGRILASGGSDTTVLLWDLAGKLQPRVDAAKWTDKDRERLWADLAVADGRKAYEAMLQLYAAPEAGVALLKQHLQPVPPSTLDNEQIAKLIRDLDDNKFAVREKAQKALAKVGPAAVELLRKALADNPSQEKKKRLETLLEKAEQHALTSDALRGLRAIEALECIGTAEARQVLTTLASGLPSARLTQDARSALKRLED
jgi:WD40 repeat protein